MVALLRGMLPTMRCLGPPGNRRALHRPAERGSPTRGKSGSAEPENSYTAEPRDLLSIRLTGIKPVRAVGWRRV
jgi:hypothetical protein